VYSVIEQYTNAKEMKFSITATGKENSIPVTANSKTFIQFTINVSAANCSQLNIHVLTPSVHLIKSGFGAIHRKQYVNRHQHFYTAGYTNFHFCILKHCQNLLYSDLLSTSQQIQGRIKFPDVQGNLGK